MRLSEATLSLAGLSFRYHTADPSLPFNLADNHLVFNSEPVANPDGDYELIREEDYDLPERHPESHLLCDTKVLRIGPTTDGRLHMGVKVPWGDAYQPIAILEKDFSRGVVFPRWLDQSGAFYHYPFHPPVNDHILFNRMACFGGGFLHCAAINYQGRALVFSGTSGVGKSTTAQMWMDRGYPILTDDRNIIRFMDGIPMVCATPFHGSIRTINPKCIPLGAVFFLEQADENRCTPLSQARAAARMMANSMTPNYSHERVTAILNTYAEALEHIPAFHLAFRPEPAAVDIVLDVLK